MLIDKGDKDAREPPHPDFANRLNVVRDSLTDDDVDQAWRAEVRRRLARIAAGDVEWADDEAVLADLRAEIQRRVSEYDAGDVKGIPMEETLAKLRALLADHTRRPAVRHAWLDETERRIEAVRAGEMPLLGADEVLADPDYDGDEPHPMKHEPP
jgi:hypothetical protein